MMTDPIADLLTRIRNGVRVERPFVDVPLLKDQSEHCRSPDAKASSGITKSSMGDVCKMLRVNLKYGPNGEHVIQHIERMSKPGCRVYVRVGDMKDVRQGTGISVLSTSKGVLSNREAHKQGVGGELGLSGLVVVGVERSVIDRFVCVWMGVESCLELVKNLFRFLPG